MIAPHLVFHWRGARTLAKNSENTKTKEIGSNVTAVQGDVSNLGDLDRLFAQIQREKGTLDIVFANAGITPLAPLGNITFALNLEQDDS